MHLPEDSDENNQLATFTVFDRLKTSAVALLFVVPAIFYIGHLWLHSSDGPHNFAGISWAIVTGILSVIWVWCFCIAIEESLRGHPGGVSRFILQTVSPRKRYISSAGKLNPVHQGRDGPATAWLERLLVGFGRIIAAVLERPLEMTDRLRSLAGTTTGVLIVSTAVSALLVTTIVMMVAPGIAERWREFQVERAAADSLRNGDPLPLLELRRSQRDQLQTSISWILENPFETRIESTRGRTVKRKVDRLRDIPAMSERLAALEAEIRELENIAIVRGGDAPGQLTDEGTQGASSVEGRGDGKAQQNEVTLDTIRSEYANAMRAFGTFAVRYREECQQAALNRRRRRDRPELSQPDEVQTEVEWVHGPSAMAYRWKTLTTGGGEGFLCTDGTTIWRSGSPTVFGPSAPAVTTQRVADLQTGDASDETLPHVAIDAIEPAAFLECIGWKLELAEGDPPVPLASRFERRCELLGKAEVQGAICWRVGFDPYVDKTGFGGAPVQNWRVEAWFDPAAGYLPRKLLVRMVGTGSDPEVVPTEHEVHSFVTVGSDDDRLVFAEKWVRTEYAAVTERNFLMKPKPLRVTRFSLIDIVTGENVRRDQFEPRLPAGLPVVTETDQPD